MKSPSSPMSRPQVVDVLPDAGPPGRRLAPRRRILPLSVPQHEPVGSSARLRGLPRATVDFSPDGKRIVSGNMDETVKLWDATGGPGMSDRDDDRNAGYSKNSRKAAT